MCIKTHKNPNGGYLQLVGTAGNLYLICKKFLSICNYFCKKYFKIIIFK